MGVLDDAIRQHIELKRQHGASEDDLRVQEQEALGPARRESPAAAAEETEAQDEAPAEAPAEGFDSRRTTVMPALGSQAADLPDPEEFHEDEPPAEPEDDDEEDVLEDTPDFLQETPEHDRMWFEQKPPRDFDFDDK